MWTNGHAGPNTVGEWIIGSPADVLSLLIYKELNSFIFYGSLILIERERISTKNPEEKLYKRYALISVDLHAI